MQNTSAVDIEGATIVAAFLENVKRIPHRPAMRRRAVHGWETLTWSDYGQAVSEVAAGLADLGIGPGECVAILAGNRVEWHLADVGALVNGGVTAPIYPTSSAEQVGYILGHSGARVCFVENDDLLAKVLEVRGALPKLDRVVVFDATEELSDPFLSSFSELRAIGTARLQREPDIVRKRASAVVGGQPATLVYTSGTTGPPKAAILTHANIMWTLRSAASFVHLASGERFLSFLPLSHVAERGMSEFAPIAIGGETWFARSLATVAEDLLDCRPTVFFAVPRDLGEASDRSARGDRPRALAGAQRRPLLHPARSKSRGSARGAGARPGRGTSSRTRCSMPLWGRGSATAWASTGPTSSSPRRRPSTRTSSAGCTPSGSLSSSSTARPRCVAPPRATPPRTTGWGRWGEPCPVCTWP